jgi:hypothetical protein
MRLSTWLTVLLPSASLMLQAQSPPNPDFGALRSLVGRCWIGTFPDQKQTDEHCFEWVFNGKFIRDRHKVRNGKAPYEGETLYGWDTKAKRVAFWYWNSEGEILRGMVEQKSDALVFPTQYETEHGPVELRAVWSNIGASGYQAEESQRVGNDWKTLWTMQFRPASAAPR